MLFLLDCKQTDRERQPLGFLPARTALGIEAAGYPATVQHQVGSSVRPALTVTPKSVHSVSDQWGFVYETKWGVGKCVCVGGGGRGGWSNEGWNMFRSTHRLTVRGGGWGWSNEGWNMFVSAQ